MPGDGAWEPEDRAGLMPKDEAECGWGLEPEGRA